MKHKELDNAGDVFMLPAPLDGNAYCFIDGELWSAPMDIHNDIVDDWSEVESWEGGLQEAIDNYILDQVSFYKCPICGLSGLLDEVQDLSAHDDRYNNECCEWISEIMEGRENAGNE